MKTKSVAALGVVILLTCVAIMFICSKSFAGLSQNLSLVEQNYRGLQPGPPEEALSTGDPADVGPKAQMESVKLAQEYPATESEEVEQEKNIDNSDKLKQGEIEQAPSGSLEKEREEEYGPAESNEGQEKEPVEVQPSESGTPPAAEVSPAECEQAAGHVIYILTAAGIDGGASYLQPGARVDFLNDSSLTQQVVIKPAGLFTTDSFTITPGSKVLTFASEPEQVVGGSIIANPGSGQTVHDVIICP